MTSPSAMAQKTPRPPADVDVLIVGAGPTGLMLALELSRYSVPFRIVDKEALRSDRSRAIVVQPRSLELLSRHGDDIPNALRSHATSGFGFNFYVERHLTATVDLTDLGFDDTAFPLPFWVSQARLEGAMEAKLVEAGRTVERPVRAEAFAQDADGVTVTLVHEAKGDSGSAGGGREETVRCKYVVGCDGAHSSVRRAAGIAFEGAPYLQSFMLCDAHVDDWDYHPNRLMMFWTRSLLAVFPLADGTVRLMCTREADDPLATSSAAPTLEEFQRRLDASMPEWDPEDPDPEPMPRLRDPVWLASFRLHHRCADRYVSGRMVIAGDAAHIHSPAGGQGMNGGIGDAANLGWKLAMVLRGERGPELLKSYGAERRRVGQMLLKGTDRIFGIANSTHWLVRTLRNAFFRWVIPVVTRARERRARAFGFMSQLRIRYRRGGVVGNAPGWRGPVRGGDRAPDGTLAEGRWFLELCRGVGYHFAVFAGVGERAASRSEVETALRRYDDFKREKSTVHVVCSSQEQAADGWHVDVGGGLHGRYGFKGPGYVLIRPDGHVEHIGPLGSLASLAAWLAVNK